MTGKHLFEHFVTRQIRIGQKFPKPARVFTDVGVEQSRTAAQRFFIFPALSQVRTAFLSKLGVADHNWNDDDEWSIK